MKKHNASNERIKRGYFAYLKEAKRLNEATVDDVAKALARFEQDTQYRDFRAFHFEQAVAFKRRLAEQQSPTTGKPLSKATLNGTLAHLKRFFQWLAGQPGFRSRLSYADADYFNLSEKDARVATARRDRAGPTLDQVRHIIARMPDATLIQRRNRALVAFTLLTGARDSAIASMKLKHVDLAGGSVYQDAREVRTKFSKSFQTYFFPVGDDIRGIVVEWVRERQDHLLCGGDDPLFPATRMVLGPDYRFEPAGLSREHWSTASPIRAVFQEACANAGLPYFNPHSLRKTLVRLGEALCQNAEQFKAWSQNLGHEGVLTTFLSYGTVATPRQGEIIHGLGSPSTTQVAKSDELTQAVLRALQVSGVTVTLPVKGNFGAI